jgi:hypothetical protein
MLSRLLCVGEELLTRLLGVSAQAGQFGLELFLRFPMLGFQGFLLCGHVCQQLVALSLRGRS